MRLQRIEVENLGGINSFGADIGAVVLVTGENAAGKTSLLNALSLVFDGGSDPDLIQRGADDGRVRLWLDDGTTIEKVQRQDGTRLSIQHEDGRRVSQPATYLKGLCGGIPFDPVAFLDTKDRVKALLDICPVTFTPAEMEAAGAPRPKAEFNLKEFGEARAAIYEERRQLNVRIRDLEGSIEQLKSSLPPESDEDWIGQRDRAHELVGTLQQRLRDERSLVASEHAVNVGKIQQTAAQAIAEIRARAESEIAQINRAAAEEALQAERRFSADLAEKTKDLNDQITNATLELQTATQRAAEVERANGTRQMIETLRREVREKAIQSTRRDQILRALDETKARKIANVPIDGLQISVDGGKVAMSINGIDVEHLSGRESIVLAVQVASLGLKELPLMIIESAELSDESLRMLCDAFEAGGVQAIIARWVNGGNLAAISPAEYFAMGGARR